MAFRYSSLADIKSELKITSVDAARDTLLTAIELSVCEHIDVICKRKFDVQSSADYYFDKFEAKLFVNYPIVSLVLTNDTTVIDAATYRYNADTGIVYNLSTYLYNENKIKATLSYGFTTIPADIKRAAMQLIILHYYDSEYGKKMFAMDSIATPDSTLNYNKEKELAIIDQRLRNRRVII